MTVSTRGLRRLWFWLHLWVGVGLAAVLIPLSLSGSYLVWRGEIDRASHPERFAVSQGPVLSSQAYLDAAQAAFGERAVAAAVRLPAQSGDPVTVTGVVGREGAESQRRHDRTQGQSTPQRRPTLTAWIDPPTGKVLDVANPREGFSMWVHDLHGQLFVFGGVGRQVVGWFGWAMLASCLTGIWLWWPRAVSPLTGLRWRRSPDELMNWHHRVGIWVAVPLAVLCLTGALISFPPVARGVAGAFGPVTPPRPGGAGGPGGPGGSPLRHTELNADQAAAAAQAAVPGARLLSVTLPTRGGDAPLWRVQLRQDQRPVNVSVEDTTAGEVKVVPERPRLGGDALIRLNRQLHGGDDTSIVWKLIITLAGMAPALLGVTGVIVWARRQLRKADMRRRLAEPAAEPIPAE